jgi:DNA adenine methylase
VEIRDGGQSSIGAQEQFLQMSCRISQEKLKHTHGLVYPLCPQNMTALQPTPISPTQPAAPYLGGKRNLAKRLVSRINGIPHTLYAEPFVGMGGVFLKRTFRPKAEVINDWSQDVTTLFRVLQRHYPDFMGMLRYQLTSRSEFERLRATDPATLTDFERSARFLYLQRTAFGGKVTGQNFGTSTERPARFDVTKLAHTLEELHDRLSGVVIECLPYHEFILKYEREHTLFYLDPPYFNCEDDYGKEMFKREDFERLADILEGIKGRFILSLNDTPETRAIFGRFDIEAVRTLYSLPKSKTKAAELIVSN